MKAKEDIRKREIRKEEGVTFGEALVLREMLRRWCPVVYTARRSLGSRSHHDSHAGLRTSVT